MDDQAQIIVAQRVPNQPDDQRQLVALVQAIPKNTGQQAREISADGGHATEVQYCLAHLLRELKTTGLRYGPAAPREYVVFAQRTTDLLREAIRFVARPNLTPERRRATRVRGAENGLGEAQLPFDRR